MASAFERGGLRTSFMEAPRTTKDREGEDGIDNLDRKAALEVRDLPDNFHINFRNGRY